WIEKHYPQPKPRPIRLHEIKRRYGLTTDEDARYWRYLYAGLCAGPVAFGLLVLASLLDAGLPGVVIVSLAVFIPAYLLERRKNDLRATVVARLIAAGISTAAVNQYTGDLDD